MIQMIKLDILRRKFLSSRKVVAIHIFKESIENGTFCQYQAEILCLLEIFSVANFFPC